jgi:hypothetical protein
MIDNPRRLCTAIVGFRMCCSKANIVLACQLPVRTINCMFAYGELNFYVKESENSIIPALTILYTLFSHEHAHNSSNKFFLIKKHS